MFFAQQFIPSMTNENKNIYKPFSPAQIDELTAIYDDFLCVVRLHEQVLQESHPYDLAYHQLEDMNLEQRNWPWIPEPITIEDKQKFDDFIANNISSDESKVFVVLQHIKTTENVVKAPIFTIPPYVSKGANMETPSTTERCVFYFSENAKLGDVEFIVDGHYKLRCVDFEKKDDPIVSVVENQETYTDFCAVLRLAERFFKDFYNIPENDIEKVSANVLAAEMLIKNENTILETLGSFVEKFQSILRERYNLPKNKKDDRVFVLAKQEGLINSVDDFQDYINIRNFIRHQWDSLDGFGCFSPDKSAKNNAKRAEYLKSYLKFCNVYDHTIYQRKDVYIKILNQMRRIISIINPNRIVRDALESNSKFVQRAKKVYAENKNVVFELNRPLLDVKHKPLNRAIKKLLPGANIIDDFDEMNKKEDYINYYLNRSWFLASLLSVECSVMEHCLMRGHNLQKSDAWAYVEKIGAISHEDFLKWQKYVHLRKELSHNFFDENLREKLRQNEDGFNVDKKLINMKIVDIRGPKVKKIGDNAYLFAYKDGLIINLDFNKYSISSRSPFFRSYRLRHSKKETYPNGFELNLISKQIAGMKTPMGIKITLHNQVVNWGDDTIWYKNGKMGYVLQTPGSIMFADNNLCVTDFVKNCEKQPVSAKAKLSFGFGHKVILDDVCRIKKFIFKKPNGDIVKTMFAHAKAGYNTISFDDGTNILQSGPEFVITHCDKALLFDGNQDFAATYAQKNISQNKTR